MTEDRWRGLDGEGLLGLLGRMLEIRGFEDEVMQLFSRNLVRASTHLYSGQEAVAVGVCSALRAGDTMTCTYRGHGAVLAMGAPLDRAMGEILGKEQGLCGGRGGSMHLADVSVGALGSFAIVGAHLPFACGTAFAAQYLGNDSVSVCFFGDGTTNIGAFHEAMNLASVWKLPVLFVCENNLYGEYSPVAATTPVSRMVDRASSYAMPATRVDGNDVLATRAAAQEACLRARAGDGPTMIEALTYRHHGHSRSDPGAYRPAGELDAWRERDPIPSFERLVLEHDQIGPDDVSRTRADAATAVSEALERALAWPEPDAADRFDFVWAAGA
ncbi:MAG: thiamine pyrophosphate-dependent dehydrogenase E1 component subunit alpha [Gaiellales bacterium]